jgi:hypothetical protein
MEKEASMRFKPVIIVAVASAAATLASAQNPAARQTQSQPAAQQSRPAETGFFRPAADPDLTAPTPEERRARAATRPAENLTAEDHIQANSEGRDADRPPEAARVMQWSEQQMERSQREAEAAKPAPGTPTPINGAFTGSTNPRDR